MKVSERFFYSPQGLSSIAHLIELTIEREGSSQNELAKLIGVSPNTLKGLRSNKKLVIYVPEPDLLIKIAPWIDNPLSGNKFEPEEFLSIARGKNRLSLFPLETQDDMAASASNDENLKALLDYYMAQQGLTETIFAQMLRIPLNRFQELRSQTSQPTLGEVIRIARFLGRDSGELAQIAGIADPPSNVADSLNPGDSLNGLHR